MKVLVLCDDLWHPGEVILRGMRKIDRSKYDMDFVMACKDILTNDMIREYDVIINAKGNCHSPGNASAPWFEPGVTAVMPDDFRAYIEEGHGFIALHSGNTYSRTRMPAMAALTGNDFIHHPPQCTIDFKITAEHPITQGVEPFSVRDEHYCIDLHAADAEVFLTGTSDTAAGTQVAGYTRLMGKGRFCCLTPGHNCAVIEHPEFAKLLCNAMDWCAGNL